MARVTTCSALHDNVKSLVSFSDTMSEVFISLLDFDLLCFLLSLVINELHLSVDQVEHLGIDKLDYVLKDIHHSLIPV